MLITFEREDDYMKTIVIVLILLAFYQGGHAAFPGKIIHDVPDANQYTRTMPLNWCVPVATVNVIDYWANVKCTPGAYGLLGTNPPDKAALQIGWFCATNGAGSTNRLNSLLGRPGTLTPDIEPALDEFIRWDKQNTFGNTSFLPRKTSSQWSIQTDLVGGFNGFKAEVNSGRPAVICFTHWDIQYVGTYNDPLLQEPIALYVWAQQPADTTQIEGSPGEKWYPEAPSPEFPGHAVTGYGYWEQFDPDGSGSAPFGNWAIVRDNWQTTPKAIAIPWNNWNANVYFDVGKRVIDVPFTIEPYTIDGQVTAAEASSAVTIQVRNSIATIKCRATNKKTIYFMISGNFSTPYQTVEYRICFDRIHDGGTNPQADDVQVIVRSDSTYAENIGDGIQWQSTSPVLWKTASHVNKNTNTFQIECEIPYVFLGLQRGNCDTLGFSIWEDAKRIWGYPSASSPDVPCAWGDFTSSRCFTPVELASFHADVQDRDVVLSWETQSESNNYGFEIQRASFEEFTKVGFVPGAGTTQHIQTYSWQDKDVSPGTYRYRLKQIDVDGSVEYCDPTSVTMAAPESFWISSNYPNPFNSSTRFQIHMPAENDLTFAIFDVNGRMVRAMEMKLQSGYHELVWDGKTDQGFDCPTGIYFAHVKGGTAKVTVKLMLVR